MKYWYKKIQLCPYWPYEALYVYLSIETHEKTHHNLYFKTGNLYFKTGSKKIHDGSLWITYNTVN